MRNIVARRLRKQALKLADYKTSEKENVIHKRKVKTKIGEKIKETIINLITERYKRDSPISIYRRLKKEWIETPRNLRNIQAINNFS